MRRTTRVAIIRDFAGDDRAVADYLASEVLDALPDCLCDFLVRTSVSDEVCGELVDALLETDGGGDVLADLERRNCFVIALDTRRKWYRYHRLFLELLRSRLAARPRREREDLHSRAARWHADNERPVDAIRHAIAAQEWRFAVDLAGERWLDVVLAGRGPALRPLLSRLPDELIEREPAIAVAFAGIQLELGGAPARVDAYLDLARDALERGPADPAVAELHAVVSLQRARSRDDRTLAEHATEMLGDIRFAEDAACYPERRALVLVMLGACESLWPGRGADASRHLRAGIALARRSEQDYLVLGGLGHLAALCVAEGRLQAGADLALEAVSLAEAHDWLGLPVSAPALLALGWAEYLWCDSASVETLARAADAARASSDIPVRLQIAALTALAQLESGDGARRALETLRGPLDEIGDWKPPGVLEQLLRSVEARILLAAGECDEAVAVAATLPRCAARCAIEARAALVHADPAAALALLEPHLADGSSTTDLATRIEVLVLAAVARHAQLDHEGAAASLERALELAGSDRFPAVFLQAGSPLRDLLARQVRHGTRHRGLVEELRVMLDRRAAGSAGIADDTTARAAQQARAHGARLSRDDALDRGDRGRALPLDEHGQDAHEEHLPEARRHPAAPRGLRGTRPAADLTGMTTPEPLPPRDVPLLHARRRTAAPAAPWRRHDGRARRRRSRWRSPSGACSGGSSPNPATTRAGRRR